MPKKQSRLSELVCLSASDVGTDREFARALVTGFIKRIDSLFSAVKRRVRVYQMVEYMTTVGYFDA